MNAPRTYKVTFTHKLFPGQTGEMQVRVYSTPTESIVFSDGFPEARYGSSPDFAIPEFAIRHFMSSHRADVTAIAEETPLAVDLSKVAFAYSGRPGCACGCRGNYRYASAHREWAEKNQGHAIEDSDVSDRSVALTVKKINSLIAAGEGTVMIDPAFISVDTETRSYAAYFADCGHSAEECRCDPVAGKAF